MGVTTDFIDCSYICTILALRNFSPLPVFETYRGIALDTVRELVEPKRGSQRPKGTTSCSSYFCNKRVGIL